MQITARILRNWADEGGIPDLTLAELDYRLVHALRAIYSDPFLRDRLCLKGGTALNKLHLPGTSRLSVDLDFNAVGTKEQVLQERTPIGEAIAAALEQQDSSYDLTYRGRHDQLTVYARFSPLRMKVTTDWLWTVWTTRKRPRLDHTAHSLGDDDVGHFSIVKRVLFQLSRFRRNCSSGSFFDCQKGTFSLDKNTTFVSNVELKIAERGFRDDVRSLIRHGTELDWETACQQVLAHFEFLGDLDDRDELFLDLAKVLLGKPYPKAREALLHGIEHPLAWLMEGLPISPEAQAMTREEVKLYMPPVGA